MTRDEIRRAVETARVRWARSAMTDERTLMVFERVNERGQTVDAFGLADQAGREPIEAWYDWPGLADALDVEAQAVRDALAADTPTPEQTDCLARHGLTRRGPGGGCPMNRDEIAEAVRTARVTTYPDGSMGFWFGGDDLVIAVYPDDDADAEPDYHRAECIREAAVIRDALAALDPKAWRLVIDGDLTVFEWGDEAGPYMNIVIGKSAAGDYEVLTAGGNPPWDTDESERLIAAAEVLWWHALHTTLYVRAATA